MIQLKASPKGLLRGEFTDLQGQECSIQESSEQSEDCLWLGPETDMHGEMVLGRMRLSREMIKELIPLLRSFVTSGSLEEDLGREFRVGVWVRGVAGVFNGIEGRVVATGTEGIFVQDNSLAGIPGQYNCAWEVVSTFWEPMEKPGHMMSRFDRIRSGDL